MAKGITAEHVSCPLCGTDKPSLWGSESGFQAMRCGGCGLVYVTPRPNDNDVAEATVMGQHQTESGTLNIKANRLQSRMRWSADVVRDMYAEVIATARPIRWLDVGAGYGELVEALLKVLPAGSVILGIEPMEHKVKAAQAIGLPIKLEYLSQAQEKYDVISLMNVFSHVPDFKSFLGEIKTKLNADGEVFIQTGNGGDLATRGEYPDPLYLPDHLVFAGEKHIEKYLADAGFKMVSIRRYRVDTPWHVFKNIVKRVLGRPSWIVVPYTSKFRTVVYRARMVQ